MFIGICKDINGGFAEYVVAHKSQVYVVPAGVSPEIGSPGRTASSGFADGAGQPAAEYIQAPVIGGGVIGAMVVKCMRALDSGCDITVVEPSTFAAEHMKKCGANRTIKGGIIDAAVEIAGGPWGHLTNPCWENV